MPETAKHDAALGPELFAAVERHPDTSGIATLPAPLPLEVDRERARFGAWYELFPRSWGGLRGVEAQVPQIAELGFDVLYVPPDPPDRAHEPQGPQQHAVAGAGRPRLAVRDRRGGRRPRRRAPRARHARRRAQPVRHGRRARHRRRLDLALQRSADHPWLTEHPEWFHRRPDGTLKYAENPPKRYQDIYNFNWDTPGLARAVGRAGSRSCSTGSTPGIKVFRVDNPHTKPFAFWEWLIAEVHKVDRDVIFLAEAFTRRAVMRELAKLGFTQSYTYFTWKTARWELVEYLSELAGGTDESEYFRPNFFVNTPDILHEYARSTAGRRPSTCASCSPPRSAPATGSTRATSTSRTCRSRDRARRSTWTPRSTRSRHARARRPAAAAHRRA